MKEVFNSRLSFLATLIWAANCFAQAPSQNSDTLKMSLQHCIDYALINNVNIINSKLDEQIAKAKVGEIRAIGLPQLNAQVGVQHNLRLRDIYGVASQNNFLSPRSAPSIYFVNGVPAQYVNGQPSPDPNATPQPAPLIVQGQVDPANEGKITKTANFFQLPNTLDASLNFSQIIFSGSYIVGLQAAQTYKDLAAKTTDQTMIQTKANVTKSYYLALINLERMTLFDANILRVDSILSQTEKLRKNGFVEQIDVDRLEVTLNNLITERQKFQNLMLLSNVLLKYQMGMPLEKNIVLLDKINDLTIDANAISSEKTNYTNRVEYTQLQTSKKLAELDLKNNRWSNLPSLVFSGNIGTFTSNTDLNLLSGKNFANPNNIWANYGLLQLGLNVPIFGGFSRINKTQQAKLTLRKTENSLKNFEQTIELQTKQTEINLRNSLQSLETQKRNIKLADNISIVTKKKYKQGSGSSLEVITAESSLKEAQVNYFNALFDAITYKVEYDLAVGNLK